LDNPVPTLMVRPLRLERFNSEVTNWGPFGIDCAVCSSVGQRPGSA
jgi:hypothetical protein